ncbi:MAG: archease [Candidatus Rokuibacteriota bacterium]
MTTETTGGYEYFETTADTGVRAWGSTRAEAFAQAALAVFGLLITLPDVTPHETREARAQGADPEATLVSWINECLYVHEIEGFVACRVEMTVVTDHLAHGLLHGEELDTARHRTGIVVKAATAHEVSVRLDDGRHEVRFIVDV